MTQFNPGDKVIITAVHKGIPHQSLLEYKGMQATVVSKWGSVVAGFDVYNIELKCVGMLSVYEDSIESAEEQDLPE